MSVALSHGHAGIYAPVIVIDGRKTAHHLVFCYEGLDDTQASQGLLYLAHAVAQA